MSLEKKQKVTRRRGATRFPRIGEAAAALGVDRTHLWRVLTGRRPSRSLLRRYRLFVAK